MAEPVNPTKTPTTPSPTPATATKPPAAEAASTPAAVTPPVVKKENKFLKELSRMLTTTFFIVLGIGLIVLSVLLKYFPGLVPTFIQPFLAHFIPRLPYIVMAFALLSLGQSRSIVTAQYTAEMRKNRQSPHAWKIPLIATQAFILQIVGFIYALIVGFGWISPVRNRLALIFLLFFFLCYVMWYVVAHIRHHFPTMAALRVATFIAFPIAGLSCFCWCALQMTLLSLFIGLFSLAAILISVSISSQNQKEQQGGLLQLVALLLSIGLLVPVAYNAIAFGSSQKNLVNLGLIVSGIEGKVEALCYSQDSEKIAFTQRKEEKSYIVKIEKVDQTLKKGPNGKEAIVLTFAPTIQVAPLEAACRPFFIQNGKTLLIDAVKNGERGIWKVDSEKDSVSILLSRGVESFGDGVHWSEKNGLFLYVSKFENGFKLCTLDPETGKTQVLFKSQDPILTPSWAKEDNEVSYADGKHGLFYAFDLKTHEKSLFMSDYERVQGNKFVPEGIVDEVIPAPDGFRYVYLTHKGKIEAIWEIHSDGSTRDKVYETKNAICNIAWHPDAQRIVFEEKYGRWDYGFISPPTNIKILDANLRDLDSNHGSYEFLIPPQISNWDPAISPDGVKIAFAASDGLWYPSFGQEGIWVAVLR